MRKKSITVLALLLTAVLCACELPNPVREVDVTPVSFGALSESRQVEEADSDLPLKTYEVAQNTVEESPDYDEMNFVLLNLYEEQKGIELEKQAAKKKKEKKQSNNSNNNSNSGNYQEWYDYNYDNSGYYDYGDSSSQGGEYYYEEPDPIPYTPPSVEGYADRVVALVNAERAKVGLESLSTTSELLLAAQKRADEISVYFSHTRPDGSSCFTIMDEYGISRCRAGENIANGFDSPEWVMDGWMNSQGHKDNILGSEYHHIGVGVVYAEGKGYYWVQIFTE